VEENMAYLLLAIGIGLVIYALKGIDAENNPKAQDKKNMPSSQEDLFGQMLFQREVLQRLDAIEEKLISGGRGDIRDGSQQFYIYNQKTLEKDGEKSNNHEPSLEDLNEKIRAMKNEGADIEEISEKLGIMKGEVLLRLGIKK